MHANCPPRKTPLTGACHNGMLVGVPDIHSTANLDAMTTMVAISDFVQAPSRVDVTATDYRGFDVRVVLRARRGGFDCAEVTASQRDGGPPVTGEALRSIALGDLIREGRKFLVATIPDPTGPIDPTARSGYSSYGLGTELPTDIRACWSASDTPNVDVALRWVAMRYVLAQAVGLPPTKEVQTAFGVSRATASRMVSLARTRGFLPTIESGNADSSGRPE